MKVSDNDNHDPFIAATEGKDAKGKWVLRSYRVSFGGSQLFQTALFRIVWDDEDGEEAEEYRGLAWDFATWNETIDHHRLKAAQLIGPRLVGEETAKAANHD